MSAHERAGESAREALRREHGVRVVSSDEEGTGAAQLPAGVYGFTGSPALESPLFAERRHRTFEIHHLPNGTIALVGFVSPAEAKQLMHGASDAAVTVVVQPDIEGDSTVIVSIPYDRIAHHRQYLVRPVAGITIQVLPTGQPLSA